MAGAPLPGWKTEVKFELSSRHGRRARRLLCRGLARGGGAFFEDRLVYRRRLALVALLSICGRFGSVIVRGALAALPPKRITLTTAIVCSAAT